MLRKITRIALIVFITLVAVCAGYLIDTHTGGGGTPFPVKESGPRERLVLAFLSDTQAPLWVETIRLEEDGNEEATEKIFDALAAEEGLAALFHLGDITALGSSKKAWHLMDRQFEKLVQAGIPVHAARGNHDYLLFSSWGERNFSERFPRCAATGYLQRISRLAVVLLNSNFTKLSEEARLSQQRWYETTLAALEEDGGIDAVIVGCHHSPLTNSTIVDPSAGVREAFVPSFLAMDKCRLFVSGHAHAAEHFRLQGKDFLVTGGGGGLLHPLLQGSERRWEDRIPHESKRAFFHYVRCERTGQGLRVTFRRLSQDRRSFFDAHAFTIPW